MSNAYPLKIATLGLGNWAGRMTELLLGLHGSSIELISVCEPQADQHAAKANIVRAAGIPVVTSLDEILSNRSVEAVFLPVPIHLHRPFTERCLAAGKAVLVEKPAAGSVQDLDAMIAARDRARLPVLVSFQDTYDPAILTLKREILSGRIGKLVSATIVGCWPRDETYYRRTTWAGKLQVEGSWVLDSPFMNAFAHYPHLTFFLLGEAESAWATPTAVEAELYRVYDIENFDTASLRFTATGIPMLVHLTHACSQSIGPLICLKGERGEINIDLGKRAATIETPGETQTITLSPDARIEAFKAFAAHVRGRTCESALSTLEAARSHVVAANGVSQSALVRAVPEYAVRSHVSPDGETGTLITGVEEAMLRCTAQGQMLHESGLVPWSAPAGKLSLLGYHRFDGCPSQQVLIARNKPLEPEKRTGDTRSVITES